MGKHLVLAGGGHAHMVALANLRKIVDRGHRVTVIGPSAYHYYSGMGPGMLGGTYSPDEIRFATKHVVEKNGGTFVQGHIDRLDPEQKTITLTRGKTISYDVISCNVGSKIPADMVRDNNDSIFPVKPIEKLDDARKQILKALDTGGPRLSLAVVGGGPAACEVAGNLHQLVTKNHPNRARIRLFAGTELMGRFPRSIRTRIRKILLKKGIQIVQGSYVKEIEDMTLTLSSGDVFTADFIFLATGVTPTPIFEKSGIPTGPDGGLLANQYLQSVRFPDIFGGGDCIYFQDQPLDKVGVYAVRENPVLYANLLASLEGTPLTPFSPGGDYLLIFNLGDRMGVLKKKWVVFQGKLAFWIKDGIDRRFIKKFQAIE